MANALQRCGVCGGLQDEQFMWVISGVRHCSVCKERALFRASAQPRPVWLQRADFRTKDYTNRN